MKKGEKIVGQPPLETDLITRTGSVGVVPADHREIKALLDSTAHVAEEVGAPHNVFTSNKQSVGAAVPSGSVLIEDVLRSMEPS